MYLPIYLSIWPTTPSVVRLNAEVAAGYRNTVIHRLCPPSIVKAKRPGGGLPKGLARS